MPSSGVAFAEPAAGAFAPIARPAAWQRADAQPRRTARVPSSPRAVPSVDPSLADLEAIYDAGMAPERWPDVLHPLPHGLGGVAAALHAGPAAGPLPIVASFGLGGAASRAYEAGWGALDPAVRHGRGRRRLGWPVTARAAATPGLERTDFFSGWMRPNGFDDALCLGLFAAGRSASGRRLPWSGRRARHASGRWRRPSSRSSPRICGERCE